MPGRRSAKIVRKKAHPDHFPEEGPVGIRVAYTELSQEAFSAWIRLSIEPSRVRLTPRARVAAMLGYSTKRCGQILDELKRKNYIRTTILGTHGRPMEVHIDRRPLIRGADGFVRLT